MGMDDPFQIGLKISSKGEKLLYHRYCTIHGSKIRFAIPDIAVCRMKNMTLRFIAAPAKNTMFEL